MLSRIICAAVGAAVLASGLSIIVILNQGVPSYDTFALMLSNLSKLSYTNTLRIMQSIILIILFVLRKYFNLEIPELIFSAASVILVTIFIDVAMVTVGTYVESNLIWLVAGFVLFTYGITLLVQSNLLLAPNDKIILAVSNKTKRTYAFYKVTSDIVLIVVAFIVISLMNYDISITIFSIVLTFFTGIFVGVFSKMNNILLRMIKGNRL